jgi:uncharacterized protein YndB with AHSA1/START domain
LPLDDHDPNGEPLPDDASVDVELTRVFNAPRDLVYRAFTDPDQLARWYGPVGFSVPATASRSTPASAGTCAW